MAQTRDIKNRIGSVKKTQKITQAMKMVSAAKFKRASDRVLKARSYSNELENILSFTTVQSDGDSISPYLEANPNANKDAVIIITGDRGLCGGFNSNIIKYAENFLNGHDKEIDLYLFGTKAIQHFKSKNYEIKHTLINFYDGMTLPKIEDVINPILSAYQNKEYGHVWLFYNEFATALSSKLTKQQLLPLKFEKKDIDVKDDYFFEPEKSSVLNEIIMDFITFTIYKSVIESKTGEEGARMAAMDAATDNAKDMIRALTLIYNRTRQAQITTELSEIVAGAEALVQ